MGLKKFTLIQKTQLNHNVFEMIFEKEGNMEMNYGQFITFILPKIGGRAYSILQAKKNQITLIIKKREIEEGGRGGSKMICETQVGETLNGVGPAGHFTLQENHKNKLFLGTGTGFVPLYNQILGSLEQKQDCQLKLIFGTRKKEDLFYVQQLEELKTQYSNFDFQIYLSSEEVEEYQKGYVTEFITPENIKNFEEFYICGIPIMIDTCIESLQNFGIKKDNIFTEKY